MLSLGLVMAFSSSVFAADVKFTGSFYAAGMYQDRTSLVEDSYIHPASEGPSTAFYYQRLRVNMDFIATPALQLKTRFDAMERVWGKVRTVTGAGGGLDLASSGTREENENIAFDYAYIWYANRTTGIWSVGIMEDGAWGTKFGDNSNPEGKITWTMVKMPFIVGLQIVKLNEFSDNAINASPYVDRDVDKYQGFVIYNWKGGQAGVLGYYVRNAAMRPDFGLGSTAWLAGLATKTDLYGLVPYAKAKIGPVAVEAEFHYQGGKGAVEGGQLPFNFLGVWLIPQDIKYKSMSAYLDALADFGMFYAGLTGAYVSGPDLNDANKVRDNIDGGRDWNPLLILWNFDRDYWAGGLNGWDGTGFGNAMTNARFIALRGGVRPIKDLDIGIIAAYARADKVAVNQSKKYGWEVDVTATYSITNNLSYMLGVGYLKTGDYFKGVVGPGDIAPAVSDNFLVINKLTLTF